MSNDFLDDWDEDFSGQTTRRETLTRKERLYINELVATGSKAIACERSGFDTPPNNVIVRRELEKLRNYYAYSVEDQTQKVINEFAKVAFFDPRELFDERGSPLGVHELESHVSACLAGVDVQTLGQNADFAQVTKYRFVDKLKALDALAKRLNLFKDDNERTVNLGGEVGVKDIGDNEKLRRIAFALSSALVAKKNSEKGEAL